MPAQYKRGLVWNEVSSLGWFCYDPEAEPPDKPELPTPVNVCAQIDSGYVSSASQGKTVGRTSVINMTFGKKWTYGDTEDKFTIYAKPGDSVQFHHILCPGAQAVRESTKQSHSDTNTSSTGPQPAVGPRNKIPSVVQDNCRITATPANYLFKNADARADCAKKGDAAVREFYSPGRAVMGGSIVAGDVGKMYECRGKDQNLLPVYPVVVNNNYQIPGFRTKPSDCGALAASDVGKTINQKLEFSHVNASSPLNGTYNWTDYWRERVCDTDDEGNEYNCRRVQRSSSATGRYYKGTASGNGTTQAQVKIPYNYVTKPDVSTSQPVLYPGGEYGVNVTIDLKPKSNPDVAPSDYATISKTTAYEVVAFTVAPSTSASSIAHANERSAGGKSQRACSYYSRGAMSCQSLLRKDDERLNDQGRLTGELENIFNGDLATPDAEPGTKFCVAVGVWPSDSHNFTGGPTGSNDVALQNSGTYWNYSEPSCRTITKKPMVQFLNSGLFTNGGVITSQTKKQVNYASNGVLGASGNRLESRNSASGIRSVFGSFSEYEAIARGEIVTSGGGGFGSGGAFVYKMAGTLTTVLAVQERLRRVALHRVVIRMCAIRKRRSLACMRHRLFLTTAAGQRCWGNLT